MRVEVGPMSSAGATEWITRARSLAAGLRGPRPALPFAVPGEVIDQFDRYFDEWEQASRHDVFHWVTEIDVELFRALMAYWLNLTQYLVDHPESRPSESAEALAF